MANPAENNVKNESPAQENKMGVMPVGKLLFTMSLPIMISMLVQALYNVVDSMFVARVSENALTALSMAFPIQNLMIAVSAGLGVGLNAVLSRALGAKDEKGVNRAATNGIMLLFICGLVFMLGGATIVRPYFEMQTDIAEIVESGVDYTTIVMLGSMGIFMQILFERLLQSTGRTLLTMVSQGVGAIANIILDPIFIFVFNMGVAGAALGTALAEVVVACIMCACLLRSPMLGLRKSEKLRFVPEQLKRAVRLGIPVAIEQMVMSGGQIVTTGIIAPLGTVSIAANSFAVTAEALCYMPGYGVQSAAVTLIGQSVGARRRDLVTRLGWVTVLLGISIMAVMSAAMYVLAPWIIGILSPDAEVVSLGTEVLRIVVFSEPLFGAAIVCAGVFQGAGSSLLSSVLNFASMWGVRITLTVLLTAQLGLRGAWIAMCVELCFRGLLFLFCLWRRFWLPKELRTPAGAEK
mgnify:CR=1 FL=1